MRLTAATVPSLSIGQRVILIKCSILKVIECQAITSSAKSITEWSETEGDSVRLDNVLQVQRENKEQPEASYQWRPE
jgi:hypothetical protein